MPARQTPLIIDQYYHVFNRGINKQRIFQQKRDYERFIDILWYYSFENPPVKFSRYLQLSLEQRSFLRDSLANQEKLVIILAYCFMPNHFHFLLRQKKEDGISIFLSKLQNSYTRFYNTKYEYSGPLLQGAFKAVRIEDNYQLLHVSRYIHLNPYTAYLVKTKEKIFSYPWSSIQEYIGNAQETICNTSIVLSEFKKTPYKDFLLDQAEYQRELDAIKHLTFEAEYAIIFRGANMIPPLRWKGSYTLGYLY